MIPPEKINLTKVREKADKFGWTFVCSMSDFLTLKKELEFSLFLKVLIR